jgi:hypothetical protein
MRKSAILLFFMVFLVLSEAHSAHIIGGKFRLNYFAADSIQIQLELERDCSGGGASFESIAFVGIYCKSNNLQIDIIELSRDKIVSSPYTYDCNGIARCVEVGYFSAYLNPNGAQFDDTLGYYLQWERCCLTTDLSNILTPESTPFSALIDIPKFKTNGIALVNSSPYKEEIFNPLICLNQDFEYDLGFHDIDGDSLVYEIIRPIAGGYTSSFNPGQNTGPKPYDSVEWALGYSVTDFIPSITPFSLNSSTGLMKFKPSQLGKYLFAMAVHEFRNGIELGTVYYESILYVYDCTSAILLQPKDQYVIDYSPVKFKVKHSDPSVTYQWQERGANLFLFIDIPNETKDSLVFTNTADSLNNRSYRCVMHKSTCDDISHVAFIHILKSGINNTVIKQITLHPNPSNTIVTISGVDEPIKVSLYSLEGKLLKEIYHSSTMDVSDILPGMYIVRVTDKNHNANYFGKLRIGE